MITHLLLLHLTLCVANIWNLNTSTANFTPSCCQLTCINSMGTPISLGFNNVVFGAASITANTNSVLQTCNSPSPLPTTIFYLHYEGTFTTTSTSCFLFNANNTGLFDITLNAGSLYFENGNILDLPTAPISLYLQMEIGATNTIITASYFSSPNGYTNTIISSNIYTASSNNWKMLVNCPGLIASSITYDASALSACKPYCATCTATTNCSKCLPGYYNDPSNNCIACPPNCLICTALTCTLCDVSHYISGTGCGACPSNCNNCTVGSACDICTEGYFADTDNLCYPCTPPCSTCETSATYCLLCNTLFPCSLKHTCPSSTILIRLCN